MGKSTRLPRALFRRTDPNGPAIKPLGAWTQANRGFYRDFRTWLRQGGYGDSALNVYSVATRLALGWLDKPYWLIDPQTDLDRVRAYIAAHYPSHGTRADYGKGLLKLAQYLRLRNHQPPPVRSINWDYYCAALPTGLVEAIRAYIRHCRRAWPPEGRHRATLETLSHLTLPLRWIVTHTPIVDISDVTPKLWFEYLDTRLAAGIKPNTLNRELYDLQQFLRFLADLEQPICARMLRVEPLKIGSILPRDVPLDQLRRLREEIEGEATAAHAGKRRMGLMDRAWFLLMLHSGLRTGEVRRLRLGDLDLAGKRVRIEQSKGLKDRVVYLSQPTVAALEAYLSVRGAANTDHLFLFRHQPLGTTYCARRLQTYGQRCGLHVTAHQLRHSCATLLLNSGAPILTVQAILGHKHIDTTLGYARLYDGTVAADYYRAMADIEPQLNSEGNTPPPPASPGQLLAMVDALQTGTLNDTQREMVQTLRSAILGLAEQAAAEPIY